MVNTITFGGVTSSTYDIYISGEGVWSAPERDTEVITIPGRNGAFIQDKGRYENITVTYPAFIVKNNNTNFATKIDAFRNAMISKIGYQRLQDTFHPDEYRMAAFIEGLEVEPILYNDHAATFDITFECKPQRYLTSGEEKKVLGTWGDTETKTGEILELENDGTLAVKSAEVALEPQQDLHGYDKPWAGGNGKNKIPTNATTTTLNTVTFTVNSDGTVSTSGTATADTGFQLYTGANNTFDLPNGTYTLTGCPTGGGSNTYRIWVDNRNSAGTGTVDTVADAGAGANITITEGKCRVYLFVKSGQNMTGKVFKPMLRLSTVSDATYEPYSNICPITGASDVDVTVRNKNLLKVTAASQTINDVVFTIDSNGVIDANGTASARVDLILNNGLRWEGGETYKVGGSIGGSASTWIIWVATHGTIASQMSMDGEGEFTQGSTAVNRVTLTIYGGVHVDHQKFYPMVRLASEGDSTFEPYNSTTTTTSLGTTVYGGSVDVVAGSGEMTWAGVDMGDLSWTYHSGNTCFYALVSGKKYGARNLMCSAYKVGNGQLSVPDGEICGAGSSSYVYVSDPHYTDATTFKTAMTGQKIVYETDPIVTLSLTPTTVNLIDGTNYVFSPQGDLTLEYGEDPYVLANPTLFASNPMIEAKGYGDITFNGHAIKLQSGVVGTVNLWNNTKSYSINGTFTKQFQTGLFNPTDTFSFNVFTTVQVTETTAPIVTNTNPSATNSISASIGLAGVSLPCTFTISTSGTATNTCTYDFGSSKTVVVDMTCTYDASTGTVNYISSTTSTGGIVFVLGKGCYCGLSTCNATSTLNRLGDPTYIDCDLGEAYKINDGDVIGLNQFIDLGSKLPELAPGINEFTVSNTFTEVAVVPRWWRI